MGEVYLAVDAVLERPVAVKVLAERHAREPEIRGRFEREGLAAARLSRERHVVTVFDVGQYGGRPFIVMEYLDGGSVHERLAQGPVPRELALTWLEQIARALDRAHEHGVVHRDVKPANLLLDSEGNVRVSDFGIASAAGLDELTLPGTILGTAGYLSPEQARGEPATPASDRYALGVIAFELLTGVRPFTGDTPATQAFAHVNAAVPSASELAPALPPSVDRVFARALAKDPAERPASCAELVAELRAALDSAPEPEEPAETAVSPALAPSPAPTARTAVLSRAPTRSRTMHVARHHAWSGLRTVGSVFAGLGAAVAAFVAWSRRRPQATVVWVAAATLAVALLAALVVDAERDGGAGAREAAPPPTAASEPPEETIAEPEVDGVALNVQGFELMQQGRFEDALPLLRQSVAALLGTGVLDEAYASYNLAYTRFALGRCDGVLGLLDRSERIQGERSEIDALRGEWEARCAAAEDGGDDDGPGRGKGKGRGKGRG